MLIKSGIHCLMESYENEFKLVNQQIEQKQINFHHGGKSVENAINKLELLKNKVKNKNEDEQSFNNGQNIFNLDDEDSENEMIEKLNEMLKKILKWLNNCKLNIKNIL